MRKNSRSNIRNMMLGGISSGALTACLVTSAMGQPAQSQAASGDVESVVVTGSRISVPGFASPTPVTAITPQELAIKGITNTPDLINEIPELQPFVSTSSGSTNVGSASVNLRGIGATRTLLLVDGRRFAPTQPTGGTDINLIPAAMIRSVDVVTGGASAAYGSDAVAGVVEVTLDDKFEGIKANIQGGSTPHMDSQELSGAFQAGASMFGGRGHVVLSLSGYSNNGVLQGNRPWSFDYYGQVNNPNCSTAAACLAIGQSRLIVTTGVTLASMSTGGEITSAKTSTGAASTVLNNTSFGPGGVVQSFTNGGNFVAGSNFAIGGDGTNFAPFASIAGKEHRTAAFTHMTYDIFPDVEVWGEILYTDSVDAYRNAPNYSASNLTVTRQNPFLPAAITSIMDANKITTFVLSRANLDLGWQIPDDNVTTQRYAGGLEGHFGETWKWQTYAQFSFNNYLNLNFNNLNQPHFANAVDAVPNPATGGVKNIPVGSPVCRSTLLNPTDGCEALNIIGYYGSFNLFGPSDSLTSGQANYVEGTSIYNATQSEMDLAANLQGQPFSDWAGPIATAAGIEYRRQAVGGTSDPVSLAAGWRQVNAVPVIGSFDVTEGYLETEVPLLADKPWAESLSLNAAGRITSYSTTGMVETWKVGLNYQPVDEIRLRATASDDIRAPNVNELFQARGQNNGTVMNPFTGLIDPSVTFLSGGNPNLKPEDGRTITAGVVYQPSWLDGFSASADYYQLHLTGAITALTGQQVVSNCFAGQTNLCSSIVRRADGTISTVFSVQFNAQALRTDGWDFETSYGFPLDSLVSGWGGDIRLHAQASWTEHLTTTASGLTTEAAGAATPHWRWNVNATYNADPFTVNLEGRWVGNSLINASFVPGDINNNQVDGRFYVTLSGSYNLNTMLQLYTRVNNLFDVDPPVDPGTLQVIHQRTSTLYDVVGRDIILGVRLKL